MDVVAPTMFQIDPVNQPRFHHRSYKTMQDTTDARPGDPGDQVASTADDMNQANPAAATHDQTPERTPLQKAEAEIADLKDAWLRAKAETENIRRQAAIDVAKAHKFGIESFAADLLAVKDSLEQALAVENATPDQLRAGVELTLRQLAAAFERARIETIDPAGQPFDPHRHQAMQLVDSEGPPNAVVQVYQKGYLLNDRVLRPALVTVAKSS